MSAPNLLATLRETQSAFRDLFAQHKDDMPVANYLALLAVNDRALAALRAAPPVIKIYVEGGCVQDVDLAGVAADYEVIDADNEGGT